MISVQRADYFKVSMSVSSYANCIYEIRIWDELLVGYSLVQAFSATTEEEAVTYFRKFRKDNGLEDNNTMRLNLVTEVTVTKRII